MKKYKPNQREEKIYEVNEAQPKIKTMKCKPKPH